MQSYWTLELYLCLLAVLAVFGIHVSELTPNDGSSCTV